MPLYEYHCKTCAKDVEVLLTRRDETPECPDCGGQRLDRQLSVPAAPAVTSGASLPTASQDCGAPRCCGGGCDLGI